MAVVQRAVQGYHYVFDELSDPRTKGWWLLSGPGPLLTILGTYVYFCVKAGPQYMKDRKPYDLKNIVMIYNIGQILLSAFMTYRGLVFIFTQGFSLNRCQPVDVTNTPNGLYWAGGVWLFFFAKMTELLDTVFFVLRKKDRQITFLHLYHHATMPIIAWIGAKYAPGGQAVPEGSINALIHVIMYTYYFLSSLGPQYQKFLWWKKYVTTLQLIQFCIIVYMNTNCLMTPDTNYPKVLSLLVLINCVAFFYMFSQFYQNSYLKNKKEKAAL